MHDPPSQVAIYFLLRMALQANVPACFQLACTNKSLSFRFFLILCRPPISFASLVYVASYHWRLQKTFFPHASPSDNNDPSVSLCDQQPHGLSSCTQTAASNRPCDLEHTQVHCWSPHRPTLSGTSPLSCTSAASVHQRPLPTYIDPRCYCLTYAALLAHASPSSSLSISDIKAKERTEKGWVVGSKKEGGQKAFFLVCLVC